MNFASILKGLKWLGAHWKLPLSAAVAVLSYGLIRRHSPDAAEQLDTRLDAIAEKLRVSKIAFDQGADAARAHVEQTYAAQIEKLTAAQTVEADKYQNDPAALAAYLMRVGGKPAK